MVTRAVPPSRQRHGEPSAPASRWNRRGLAGPGAWRTPLDWLIDRYHVVQDRQSGIVNDPNAWFDKPEDLLATIQRIVHVSVETVRITEGLPTVDIGGAVKE